MPRAYELDLCIQPGFFLPAAAGQTVIAIRDLSAKFIEIRDLYGAEGQSRGLQKFAGCKLAEAESLDGFCGIAADKKVASISIDARRAVFHHCLLKKKNKSWLKTRRILA